MRLTEIEARAATTLLTPIHVVAQYTDDDGPALNAVEEVQLASFEFENRRRDWRRGRVALKSLLNSLGRSDDTSRLSFPDAQLSLTHGDGTAYAVGTFAANGGIGVDFETVRPVRDRVVGWFLNEPEIDWLAQSIPADRDRDVIRLWTIKEAVFKCHPDNAGLVLSDFTIADPAAEVCEVRAADGRRFQTMSCHMGDGILSIAVPGDCHED